MGTSLVTSFSWAPVIAGLIGAAAALTGVWLTQRANRQQRLEERLERRRLEQRDVIVDLIEAVEHWAPRARFVAFAMTRAKSRRDALDFADSNSVRELGESVRHLQKLLVRCRLIVTDPCARPVVLKLADAVREQGTAGGQVLDRAGRSGDPDELSAAVKAVAQLCAEAQAVAMKLEEVALQQFT